MTKSIVSELSTEEHTTEVKLPDIKQSLKAKRLKKPLYPRREVNNKILYD